MGPFVEVLSALGHSAIDQLSVSWRRSHPSSLRRLYDAPSSTYTFSLTSPASSSASSSPTTECRITSPSDARLQLGLKQPFLVLQLRLSVGRHFSFETTVLDKNDRRTTLSFSTAYRQLDVGTNGARIPLNVVANQWTNLAVPVQELVAHLWNERIFDSIASLTICANCCIRRVFTLRSIPKASTELSPAAIIPKALRMPPTVFEFVQLLWLNEWRKRTDSDVSSLIPLETAAINGDSAHYPSIISAAARAHLHRPSIDPLSLNSSMNRQRMKMSSAPPKTPSRRWESVSRKQRSSSLPRIQHSRLSGEHGNGTASEVVPVRQAWRGPSAKNEHRSRAASEPRERSTEDLSLEAMVQKRVLDERMSAVFAGPDEVLRVSDSEDDLTISTTGPRMLPPILPVPSAINPVAAPIKSPLWPPSMDADEAAMLQSLKRQNSDADNASAQLGAHGSKVSDLSRHEFNDSSEEEEEEENGDEFGPIMQPVRTASKQRSPSMDSSFSSVVSFRDPVDRMEENTAPVLDLIFDPELNCYYSPHTKQYYQVTPAAY